MVDHVIEARYVGDHVVWLRFRDGTAGEIDLKAPLEGPLFEPLHDPAVFLLERRKSQTSSLSQLRVFVSHKQADVAQAERVARHKSSSASCSWARAVPVAN